MVQKLHKSHYNCNENPSPNIFTHIKPIAEKFGPIEKANVILDGPSKRSRGFGFVYFESMEDAITAREEMNGQHLDGRALRVDFSVTKEAHKPTPGEMINCNSRYLLNRNIHKFWHF